MVISWRGFTVPVKAHLVGINYKQAVMALVPVGNTYPHWHRVDEMGEKAKNTEMAAIRCYRFDFQSLLIYMI